MRPMDIEVLPSGDMLYVDRSAYEVKRIALRPAAANQAPTAVATPSITSRRRAADRALRRDRLERPGRGDALTYEWDLDGDGALDDSTAAKPSFTYTAAGHLHRHAAGDRRPRAARTPTTVTITVTDAVTTLQFTPDHGRARGAGELGDQLRHLELPAGQGRHEPGGRELPALPGVGHHRPDPEREAARAGAEQRHRRRARRSTRLRTPGRSPRSSGRTGRRATRP